MLRPSILIVSAIAAPVYAQTDKEVAARLTPAVYACEQAPDHQGTVQQAECYADEANRQDHRLNATWVRVMATLSPARRDRLRQSERAWIKDRNNECKAEGDTGRTGSSTAAYMFHYCMANEAIRRKIWLERIR